MQLDMNFGELPIHIRVWPPFKNKIWDVYRGDKKIGYLSHDIDDRYSYNDLTKKLLERKRIKLKAECYDECEKEIRSLLYDQP